MKRLVVAIAVCLSLAAASVAAAASGSQAVTVTPRSGSIGTTFTITFLTPSAAGTRGYRVHAQVANAASKGESCQTSFDFFTPKKVAANQHIKFTFRVAADQGLCTGRWTVTVRHNGSRILRAGHFTLR